MVILGSWQGRPIVLSLKPNCVTVSLDDPAEATVLSFDMEGRLWTAMLDGISYRRGLDGRVLAKWRTAGDGRKRRWLSAAEADDLLARTNRLVVSLHRALSGGQVNLKTPLPSGMLEVLASVVAFDPARAHTDAQVYRDIYLPVGILPPDQYMAVVLQATEGCSFNTCTFCSFYKNRPFRIRPVEEFRVHALAVRDFLGAGLSLRRTIFIGDANALVVPMPKLIPLLHVVHEVYDVEALGGVFAFLDGFSGEKKSVEDYATLRDLGLARVYIGLESGHDPLLRFLRKPGTAREAVQAVSSIKASGVAVGVIVLLGAGGRQYSPGHVRDTARALNAMRLDGDDIVYLSELITDETLPYAQDAARAGLTPLPHEERMAQAEAIEHRLRFPNPKDTPPVSRYDIREFVY
jgi:hypothetical protein